MNRITRLLAVAGLGLGAAIALAGPAQAATGTASHSASASVKADWNDDNDDVVGYYDSPRICERVGRIGEINNRWDDYDCNRVFFGFHRGDWELSVSNDDHWGGGFHHGGPFDHGDHGHGHGHDHGHRG